MLFFCKYYQHTTAKRITKSHGNFKKRQEPEVDIINTKYLLIIYKKQICFHLGTFPLFFRFLIPVWVSMGDTYEEYTAYLICSVLTFFLAILSL